MPTRRPTREELEAAMDRALPDIAGPGMRVLFCGINPSLYSVAVGHHFARPGNRFWKALHGGGFTPRVLDPSEDQELPRYGCGLTNVVPRATAAAAELSHQELVEGGRSLEARVRRYRPRWLAVLGLGAYRTAFARSKAGWGPQDHRIGETGVWVLPNPSGLNASFKPADFARLFAELREAM